MLDYISHCTVTLGNQKTKQNKTKQKDKKKKIN